MTEQVWTHGYNSCLHVAISALNYLSSHPRPTGGQEAYNAEHLLQIADDLKRTIAHNVKVTAANNDMLVRALRDVMNAGNDPYEVAREAIARLNAPVGTSVEPQ